MGSKYDMVENTAVYKIPSTTCGAEFQQQKNFSQDLCCGETPPPEENESNYSPLYIPVIFNML
jgi:hypothetical protein